MLLLIACANVANLLLARSMSRRIEMALRMSIGAARGRLMQLMLVESAMLAVLACAAGALFAAWSAPFIVSMLAPEEQPVRLVLDPDWRALALGASLTLIVTLLFGVIPAVRASAVTPLGALKEMRAPGGQRRHTDALVIAQMALCVFLLFGASLFVGSFDRLTSKPLGFDAGNVLHVNAEAADDLAPAVWTQLAAQLRELPGVESVAVAGWAPLSGNRWRSSITVAGNASPSAAPNWVNVAPGYFETMRTPVVSGREFRAGETPPRRDDSKRPVAGVAIVNQAFARAYFDGQDPVGRVVKVDSTEAPMTIVGLTGDAVYFNVRETMYPTVFVPFYTRSGATLLVRTAPHAGDLRAVLRREVSRIRPDIRARQVVRLESFVTRQMVRERLLAALSTFFAVLALLLAVIGMYGVLNYAVTCERRDIGLRMALGARPSHVLRLMTRRLAAVIGAGAAAGLACGLAFGRYVRTLLFEMEPADPVSVAVAIVLLAAAATAAAIAPTARAMRIDPAETLKSEA
jgi:predicted permease